MRQYSDDPPGGVIEGELVPLDAGPPGELVARSRVSPEQRAAILGKFLQEKGARSAHTAARYRRDLTAFFEWVDGKGFDVFDLRPWQMSEWAAEMKAADVLKASTRAGRINAVSSFYRFCQAQARDVVPQNPAEHTPRPEVSRRSRTRKLTADELTRLRAKARKRPQAYALVQLLAGSGIRISEALESDTHHLKREGTEWYLYVIRKGSEDRVPVQVPVEAVRAVHRYTAGRRGPLFVDRDGRRLSRRAALNKIQYAAIRAGIKDRNVSGTPRRRSRSTRG